MRHYKKGRKLGTDASHTKAIKKNLAVALFTNDRIKTTETRAKEVRRVIDHIITWAKKGDLHSRRLAIAALGDKELVREVFEKAAQGMWEGRNGGYTRIMKLGPRKGDNAPMVILELIEEVVVPKAKAEDKKSASKSKAKSTKKAAEAVSDESTDIESSPEEEVIDTEADPAAVAADEEEVADEAKEGRYSAAKQDDEDVDARFDEFKEDKAGKDDDVNEAAEGEADRVDAIAQTDVREDAVAVEKAEEEASVEEEMLEREEAQVAKAEEENIEKIKEDVAREEKELIDAVNPVSEDEDAFEEAAEAAEKHEDAE